MSAVAEDQALVAARDADRPFRGGAGECGRRLSRAKDSAARAGDRHGEAETLRDVGDLLHHLGRPAAAHGSWRQALAAFEELGDPLADELRARLRTHTSRIGPAGQAG